MLASWVSLQNDPRACPGSGQGAHAVHDLHRGQGCPWHHGRGAEGVRDPRGLRGLALRVAVQAERREQDVRVLESGLRTVSPRGGRRERWREEYSRGPRRSSGAPRGLHPAPPLCCQHLTYLGGISVKGRRGLGTAQESSVHPISEGPCTGSRSVDCRLAGVPSGCSVLFWFGVHLRREGCFFLHKCSPVLQARG